MNRTDTVTRVVQVLDIVPGDPPHLLTAERLRRNGKPGRLFQQLIPVPDTHVFARLAAQVSKGDTITVTVVTEWRDREYWSYLCEFVSFSIASSEPPEEVRA